MKDIIRRATYFYVIVVLICIAVIVRIVHLQFFADLKYSSEKISYRIEETEASRGNILACDGRFLASSVPYYSLRMDCIAPSDTLFNNNIAGLASALSEFFGDKTPSQYMNDLVTARKKKNRYKQIGNRIVDYSELETIKRFPIYNMGQNKGGLVAEQKYKRTNPYGRLAYRTIGFINSLGVGVGIEGSYDYYLKGIAGKQTVQRLLGGEWMPVNSESAIAPKDGYDVQTTIDIDIQEVTENALRNQLSLSDVFEGATAIIMEVKTGAVRAVANMHKQVDGTFDESFNYAIGQATEPGSTFKLATLVALIEDGYVTLESPIDAGNGKWQYSTKTFTDVTPGGYGQITVQKAFEKSSNVAFAKLAVEYYANNEKQYVDRIHNMKLSERFNLDIMGEGRAVIHSPGDAMWSKLTLPMMAMGYASLLTPLHTLTFYNAIANDGKMMKPYFVSNLQRNGKIEKEFEPQELSGAICSESTVKAVKQALRAVVEHGTAKAINDKRYQISGKTGTAQIAFDGRYIDAGGYRKHQASFAGFFPSENPKYSIIVVLYTNKTRANFYGGAWAAPVFKQVADYIFINSRGWTMPIEGKGKTINQKPYILGGSRLATESILSALNHKNIELPKADWIRESSDSTGKHLCGVSIIKDTMPDLSNMGIRDALYLMENLGYCIRFTGKGKVVAQNPAPGTFIDKKTTIQLQLADSYETTQDSK